MSLFLAPFVPDQLRAARSLDNWTKDGTFVFADISGFTRLSEQLAELGKAGAEELTHLLNGTFEALLGVARDEGGDLVKFGGDALFLFFEGPDHAVRACRAAHGMRAALKARGAVSTDRGRVLLRISMGVHSGPYLFVLTKTTQCELFVLGRHATTVTAMEAAADAGEILMSGSTAALVPSAWLGASKADGVLLRRVGRNNGPSDATAAEVIEASRHPSPQPPIVLDPFVPHAVARRLLAGDHDAEHRHATVAFVHVGGLDSLLSERGAFHVREVINELVSVALDAAQRHDVCLLATDVAGGGIKLILTAGVPDAVEDGEGRMLAVGRAVIDAGVGLPVRVGVNTGYVFAGEVGAPWRRVYTVMGDAVNVAARLMAKAGPNELIASRSTLEHSATPFEATPLEPFLVKGKRQLQQASSIGARIEGRGRVAMGQAAFTGRATELGKLTALLARAVDGDGSCVEVIGEAGIGKSRLVLELVSAAAPTRVVRLTCEPFAVDRPYFVARVLLRTALGVPLDADSEVAGRALLGWLAQHTPDLLPWAPLLAIAFDADVPDTAAVSDLGAGYRAARLREVASTVLHRAFGYPLLLVVEDAMWMDEASSTLLASALNGVASCPWLACLTTRDRSQGLASRLGFEAHTLELAPLDDAHAQDLASGLTDDAEIPHSELLELIARARGNPLFLLELAHARRELGSLDAIPSTLEDLVSARIDRLAPHDRNLLRHAAVLGDRFSPLVFEQTLGDMFRSPVPWKRLGDFVVVDQGEFRFSHDLVRRVAYASLPFRRRRELHLKIGRALVPTGVPDDARLGLLALHFDGSGDHAVAWHYNRLAGERARDNYATVEATAFFDRAIDNARGGGSIVAASDLADVYESLADVALLAGRYDLAKEGLRGARKLVGAEPRAIARLCRKEGKLREQLGRHAAAMPWYRRGLVALDTLPDTDTIAAAERSRLQVACASTLIWRQRYRQCAAWCVRALPHALSASDRATEAHAYYLLDWALGELGDSSGLQYRELAQPIYEELGDFAGLASVLNNHGVDALVAARWDEACGYFEQSREARRRAGDVVGMAQCAHNLAEVRAEQGRFVEAEAYLREARRIWRASGYAMGVAAATNTLGRTLARTGRPDEGIDLLTDARQRFIALAHGPFLAETEGRLAEALLFAGRPHEAIEVLDELGDRAAEGGPPVAALAIRMRATAVAMLGDHTRARLLLDDARACAESGDVAWEAALATIQIAHLAGTDAVERERCEHAANEVFTRMGIDAHAVIPPYSKGS
ncbi:MAG: hypothetical protein RLZZ623_2037 [Actinomycetota bacterium]